VLHFSFLQDNQKCWKLALTLKTIISSVYVDKLGIYLLFEKVLIIMLIFFLIKT